MVFPEFMSEMKRPRDFLKVCTVISLHEKR